MIKALQAFDGYALQARLYPALIAISPILITSLLLWEQQIPKKILPLLGGLGFLFFVANFVRGAGQRLEKKLVRSWGGLPTTQRLRHRDETNKTLSQRRRRLLRELTGMRFPTAASEGTDPQRADEIYISATRVLIARVRDKQENFPRVHEENIHYGFRRNLLALKPLALITLVATFILDAFVLYNGAPKTPEMIAAGLHGIIALTWIFVVNSDWVFQAGETYAERLFDALEDPSLTTQAPPGDL